MSYCGYITRVKELRKHSNADRLQVATIFGNDVIVGLDVQLGSLGVYFPTDGKLGLEYARSNNLLREKDKEGNSVGGYLDAEKRNIKALKLRGEKSDGLFMPLESLSNFCDISTLKEGNAITTLNGVLICEKYIPKGKERKPNPVNKNKKKKPKESYPFFEQHVDTSQLTYNMASFKEGDLCYITLKLHGTSQRTAHTIKERRFNFIEKILNFIGIKNKTSWEYISGTRRVTLDDFSGGFYGSNEFREKWHKFFEGKLQKGEEAFYEVVSYVNDEKLIMPECDNRKTKDKDFVKKYGEKTRFTYGCEKGQNDIYVYRMTMTNEDGHTVEYPTELVQLRCEQIGVKHVPVLDKFIYTTTDDLMDRVKKYEDGADPIGKTHTREGVIVRIDNKEKFTAFKHKNFWFKVLEGIIKDEEILDTEEAESIRMEV